MAVNSIKDCTTELLRTILNISELSVAEFYLLPQVQCLFQSFFASHKDCNIEENTYKVQSINTEYTSLSLVYYYACKLIILPLLFLMEEPSNILPIGQSLKESVTKNVAVAQNKPKKQPRYLSETIGIHSHSSLELDNQSPLASDCPTPTTRNNLLSSTINLDSKIQWNQLSHLLSGPNINYSLTPDTTIHFSLKWMKEQKEYFKSKIDCSQESVNKSISSLNCSIKYFLCSEMQKKEKYTSCLSLAIIGYFLSIYLCNDDISLYEFMYPALKGGAVIRLLFGKEWYKVYEDAFTLQRSDRYNKESSQKKEVSDKGTRTNCNDKASNIIDNSISQWLEFSLCPSKQKKCRVTSLTDDSEKRGNFTQRFAARTIASLIGWGLNCANNSRKCTINEIISNMRPIEYNIKVTLRNHTTSAIYTTESVPLSDTSIKWANALLAAAECIKIQLCKPYLEIHRQFFQKPNNCSFSFYNQNEAVLLELPSLLKLFHIDAIDEDTYYGNTFDARTKLKLIGGVAGEVNSLIKDIATKLSFSNYAGIILGLGMRGYWINVSSNVIIRLLSTRLPKVCDTHMSASLIKSCVILGVACSNIGSKSKLLHKMFMLHIPHNIDSRVHEYTARNFSVCQVSMISLGLLYANSRDASITEILLQMMSQIRHYGFIDYQQLYFALSLALLLVHQLNSSEQIGKSLDTHVLAIKYLITKSRVYDFFSSSSHLIALQNKTRFLANEMESYHKTESDKDTVSVTTVEPEVQEVSCYNALLAASMLLSALFKPSASPNTLGDNCSKATNFQMREAATKQMISAKLRKKITTLISEQFHQFDIRTMIKTSFSLCLLNVDNFNEFSTTLIDILPNTILQAPLNNVMFPEGIQKKVEGRINHNAFLNNLTQSKAKSKNRQLPVISQRLESPKTGQSKHSTCRDKCASSGNLHSHGRKLPTIHVKQRHTFLASDTKGKIKIDKAAMDLLISSDEESNFDNKSDNCVKSYYHDFHNNQVNKAESHHQNEIKKIMAKAEGSINAFNNLENPLLLREPTDADCISRDNNSLSSLVYNDSFPYAQAASYRVLFVSCYAITYALKLFDEECEIKLNNLRSEIISICSWICKLRTSNFHSCTSFSIRKKELGVHHSCDSLALEYATGIVAIALGLVEYNCANVNEKSIEMLFQLRSLLSPFYDIDAQAKEGPLHQVLFLVNTAIGMVRHTQKKNITNFHRALLFYAIYPDRLNVIDSGDSSEFSQISKLLLLFPLS